MTSRFASEQAARLKAERQLLAFGGLFEGTEEQVLGESMHVFKQRAPHLRALLEGSQRFDDAPYTWLAGCRASGPRSRRCSESAAPARLCRLDLGY